MGQNCCRGGGDSDSGGVGGGGGGARGAAAAGATGSTKEVEISVVAPDEESAAPVAMPVEEPADAASASRESDSLASPGGQRRRSSRRSDTYLKGDMSMGEEGDAKDAKQGSGEPEAKAGLVAEAAVPAAAPTPPPASLTADVPEWVDTKAYTAAVAGVKARLPKALQLRTAKDFEARAEKGKDEFGRLNEVLGTRSSEFSKCIELLDEGAPPVEFEESSKTRFQDVTPYLYNHLREMGSWISETTGAIQWPLPENLQDLYLTVVAKRVRTIIALGPVVDTEYWDPDTLEDYAELASDSEPLPALKIVEPFETMQDSDDLLRHIRLEATVGAETQAVEMINFHSWKDYHAPSPSSLDAVLRLADIVRKSTQDARVLVHCRAGVGRTGTVILIARCWNALEANGHVDVVREWAWLRLRRAHTVQQAAQYVFVFTALAEIARRLEKEKDK